MKAEHGAPFRGEHVRADIAPDTEHQSKDLATAKHMEGQLRNSLTWIADMLGNAHRKDFYDKPITRRQWIDKYFWEKSTSEGG